MRDVRFMRKEPIPPLQGSFVHPHLESLDNGKWPARACHNVQIMKLCIAVSTCWKRSPPTHKRHVEAAHRVLSCGQVAAQSRDDRALLSRHSTTSGCTAASYCRSRPRFHRLQRHKRAQTTTACTAVQRCLRQAAAHPSGNSGGSARTD